MRFTDIELEEIDLNGDGSGNYIAMSEDLIEAMNAIRKRQGNTDLVGVEYDNDVYYNFYLMFNPAEQKIDLTGTCNHGEKDDFVVYYIDTTGDEERMLIWKLIEQLVKEIE